MSRCKKKFIALAACLSVGLLSLGFFAWNLEISTLLKTTVYAESRGVQLVSVKEPANDFAAASYDEATRDVFGAEYAGSDAQIVIVGKFFLRTLLTSKVSRYIAKSVLIL